MSTTTNSVPASGSNKRLSPRKQPKVSSGNSVPTNDIPTPSIQIPAPADKDMFADEAMEGIESTERPIQCFDWKEHVGKILATQSNNMFKELIEE